MKNTVSSKTLASRAIVKKLRSLENGMNQSLLIRELQCSEFKKTSMIRAINELIASGEIRKTVNSDRTVTLVHTDASFITEKKPVRTQVSICSKCNNRIEHDEITTNGTSIYCAECKNVFMVEKREGLKVTRTIEQIAETLKGLRKVTKKTTNNKKTKPGVIKSIVKVVQEHGPIQKEDILEKLSEIFPDRDKSGMLRTINAQLTCQINKYGRQGVMVKKTDDGWVTLTK